MIHALTPGDHYSPRTGSAVPTVVHGLASAAQSAGDPKHGVLVAAGTYAERYESAVPIEYRQAIGVRPWERYVDLALGRVVGRRPAARRVNRPLATSLHSCDASVVLTHNLPELPALIGPEHASVLYAHNQLLRTYSVREARRVLARVAAIVAVSESLAAQLRHYLPREFHRRLRVVRNGVDCTQFWPAPHARAESVHVIFVGRMIHDKGAHVLLEAAKRLRGHQVRYTIVGSSGFDARAPLTPYEVGLRRLAAGSGANVSFQPFVDRLDVPQLLRAADIVVIPSIWADPAPLAVGEGMASGVPVVASRIGGIPELVGDAAMLVAPGDADDLAQALEALIIDADAARALGQAARRHAEAHDWGRAWTDLRAVLESLD